VIDWSARTGKQWKEPKKQFRPGMQSARKTYEARQADRVAMAAMKAREKEMKEEKTTKKKVSRHHPHHHRAYADSSQEQIQALKERREKAEEKARYEKLAARMHQKKIDRMKRREKRNKALKER